MSSLYRSGSNSGAFLMSSLVRSIKILLSSRSTDLMVPAGSMTFLPKIQGPVSTTRYEPPTSWVASSTFPMLPSSASTLNPVMSTFWMFGTVSRHVQISYTSMVPPPFALSGPTRWQGPRTSGCQDGTASEVRTDVPSTSSAQALPDPPEYRIGGQLNGNGREQQAHDSSEEVDRARPEQPGEEGSEPQRSQHDHEGNGRPADHGHPLGQGRMLTGEDDGGNDRSRSSQERGAQRHQGHARVFRGDDHGLGATHHVQGHQEQEHPAGDHQALQADREITDEGVAEGGEASQHGACDQDGHVRSAMASLRLFPSREGQEERDVSERIEDHQEGDERLAEGSPGHFTHRNGDAARHGPTVLSSSGAKPC